MPTTNRDQHIYHKIFFSVHGEGPHICYFCGEVVPARWTGYIFLKLEKKIAIHHKDGDHFNNDPDNLAMSHGGCHTSHHRKGYKNHWVKPCEPGCTCRRHADYSARRVY